VYDAGIDVGAGLTVTRQETGAEIQCHAMALSTGHDFNLPDAI